MSDDLIICCLILVFLQKIRGTGKCNLIDILVDLIGSHTDSVINKGKSLVLCAGNDVNAVWSVIAFLEFTNQCQLAKLCNCIAGIGYHLTDEDIVIGI